VLQAEGGDGQDGNPVLVDQEWVLVRAVDRAAILDDAQPARRTLFGDSVIEHDDAVGDVLLESVTGEGAIAPLARDHGRDPAILEPTEQPAQFGAQDGGVGQSGEQCLDGIQHDPLGADRVDGIAQPDEQPLRDRIRRLLDLAALDSDVVEQQSLVRHELVEIEAERPDVLGQLFGGLLEGHEHTGFTKLGCAAHQELHREERLATAGPTAHERRPAARQPSAGDLVEPGDSGGGLREERGPG
jgi:hypothetical protein